MKLKEFLKIVNYENFCVSREIEGQLKTLCKITEYIPIECLSDKLLNSEIETIFIDEDFKKNKNDLIDIVINWED